MRIMGVCRQAGRFQARWRVSLLLVLVSVFLVVWVGSCLIERTPESALRLSRQEACARDPYCLRPSSPERQPERAD